MKKEKIGIIILATNAYFILGLRLIKKFDKHYKGDKEIIFHFFADQDPKDYLPTHINVQFYYRKHNNWLDGTNSKFENMLSLSNSDNDYIVYIDADTNIIKDFIHDWFIGETIGLEHFGNNGWMKEAKGYDRNPISKAYVPLDTILPQMYYHGSLFGGSRQKISEICQILRNNQKEDKKIPYEPGVNDESYINQYYHYHPPSKTILIKDYEFIVSDKGGIGNTRNMNLDILKYKDILLSNKERVFDIINGDVILL